jgi:hypothetical protein
MPVRHLGQQLSAAAALINVQAARLSHDQVLQLFQSSHNPSIRLSCQAESSGCPAHAEFAHTARLALVPGLPSTSSHAPPATPAIVAV